MKLWNLHVPETRQTESAEMLHEVRKYSPMCSSTQDSTGMNQTNLTKPKNHHEFTPKSKRQRFAMLKLFLDRKTLSSFTPKLKQMNELYFHSGGKKITFLYAKYDLFCFCGWNTSHFCVLLESKHMIVMNSTVCTHQRSGCPLLLHIKTH